MADFLETPKLLMSIFNKNKSTIDGQTKLTTKPKEELVIVERPKICCIDLTETDFESLKESGYNLFQGTLGATMKIPNKSRQDYSHILLDYLLPPNFHEYDILILDLTNEAIKKFNIPIIPENTTILSFKMTVGKLTITTEEMLSNEAIAHLKTKSESLITTEYVYLYLQNLDFNSLGSTSSIVTAINSTIIKDLDFVIPKENFAKAFQENIKTLFEKVKNNSKEIQTITQSRDELLPKLMKGEIRVK